MTRRHRLTAVRLDLAAVRLDLAAVRLDLAAGARGHRGCA